MPPMFIHLLLGLVSVACRAQHDAITTFFILVELNFQNHFIFVEGFYAVFRIGNSQDWFMGSSDRKKEFHFPRVPMWQLGVHFLMSKIKLSQGSISMKISVLGNQYSRRYTQVFVKNFVLYKVILQSSLLILWTICHIFVPLHWLFAQRTSRF